MHAFINTNKNTLALVLDFFHAVSRNTHILGILIFQTNPWSYLELVKVIHTNGANELNIRSEISSRILLVYFLIALY